MTSIRFAHYTGRKRGAGSQQKKFQRSRDHHERLAAQGIVQNDAFANPPPQPGAPSLPSITSPLPSLPMPTHRAVRRLTIEDQQAADTLPRRSSPDRDSSPVVEESPASPIVHCSQYRLEEYEKENGPLTGHDCQEKVGGWLRDVQAAYSSDGLLPPDPVLSLSPMQPAATMQPVAPCKYQHFTDSDSEYSNPRRGRTPPATLFRNAELFVHKDYDDRLPLCYYATGLNEGGPHDVYMCFDNRDIEWARRVRFHNERRRD